MNDVVAITGASDPEMTLVKKTLDCCGIKHIQAVSGGKPVHPGNAYKADPVQVTENCTVLRIECEPESINPAPDNLVVIDHHRPGDPGFGQPPEKYWEASSIGQVFKWLEENNKLNEQAKSLLQEAQLAAAADHCLGAAYKGQCPELNVQELMEWRIKTKANFQKVSPDEIREKINEAFAKMNTLSSIKIGGDISVINSIGVNIPEFPEALAIAGKAAVYSMPTPDGKTKVGILNGTPEEISAFMNAVKISGVFSNVYGDPQRGFAGAYVSELVRPQSIAFALSDPLAMKEIVDFNLDKNEMPKAIQGMEESLQESTKPKAQQNTPGINH